MPAAVAVGADGSLYIADRGMHRVFKVTNPGPNGVLSFFAGTGRAASQSDLGRSPEGKPARLETLNAPGGVAVGPDGTVYIADTHNSKIRKVTPDGRIFSVAAGRGAFSWSGDSADARAADLNQPQGIAVGPDGTVYFMDALNVCARKVTPGGALVTVAGLCARASGPAGAGFPLGDGGAATEASFGASAAIVPGFGGPEDLALGPDGCLYIADTYNSRIRKVTPDGRISTVAGNGEIGDAGDAGPASAALLAGPRGVAIDKAGNLAIADTENNKVRVVAAGR
jgi:sugar lactone lactonase YvrE